MFYNIKQFAVLNISTHHYSIYNLKSDDFSF